MDLEICRNGFQPFVTNIIEPLGNLTTGCWRAMVCLTKVKTSINGIRCSQFIQNGHMQALLATCDWLIRFPSRAILHHHVHFSLSPRSSQQSID